MKREKTFFFLQSKKSQLLEKSPLVEMMRFLLKDLKDQIKTKEYNILDVTAIKSDVTAIQKYYEEKGYYLANVDYEITKNKTGNVDLTFNIREFDKVRVKRIMFLGNKALPTQSLKALCKLVRSLFFLP